MEYPWTRSSTSSTPPRCPRRCRSTRWWCWAARRELGNFFGFQGDNVRNQTEHALFLLANHRRHTKAPRQAGDTGIMPATLELPPRRCTGVPRECSPTSCSGAPPWACSPSSWPNPPADRSRTTTRTLRWTCCCTCSCGARPPTCATCRVPLLPLPQDDAGVHAPEARSTWCTVARTWRPCTPASTWTTWWRPSTTSSRRPPAPGRTTWRRRTTTTSTSSSGAPTACATPTATSTPTARPPRAAPRSAPCPSRARWAPRPRPSWRSARCWASCWPSTGCTSSCSSPSSSRPASPSASTSAGRCPTTCRSCPRRS
ncbi:unnamed protein product [Heterosigma akashiwo]